MTKFLIDLEIARGEDNVDLFEKLVQMQVQGLLGPIIPTKPWSNEGGPTRILAVTADREHNEAARIALDIFALPGIMSFKTREVVPLLRGQPLRHTPRLPRRRRG